jgi:hypothetical protein
LAEEKKGREDGLALLGGARDIVEEDTGATSLREGGRGGGREGGREKGSGRGFKGD